MKEKHAFWHGYISDRDFVRGAPHGEGEPLVRFGSFAVEVVWLDEEL